MLGLVLISDGVLAGGYVDTIHQRCQSSCRENMSVGYSHSAEVVKFVSGQITVKPIFSPGYCESEFAWHVGKK